MKIDLGSILNTKYNKKFYHLAKSLQLIAKSLIKSKGFFWS